jgi:hypothetical protein
LTLPPAEYDGEFIERYIVAVRHHLIWRGVIKESKLDKLMAAVP